MKDRCDQFLAMARADPQGRIGEVRRKLTETHGFGDEDFMTVVRHLLANKKMSMDLDVAPDFNGSLAQFDLGGGA